MAASVKHARTLRAWSDAQCARLAAYVDDRLRDWRQSWGIERGASSLQTAIRCEAAAHAPRATMAWQTLGDGAWCALAPSRHASGQDRTASFPLWDALLPYLLEQTAPRASGPTQERGVRRPAGLAQDTAQAAWADCVRRLAGLFDERGEVDAPAGHDVRQTGLLGTSGTSAAIGTFAKPAADLWRPWSGALMVTAHWRDVDVHVLIDDRSVAAALRGTTASASASATTAASAPAPAPPAPRTPLVPLGQALAPLPVALRVELAPVEITLAALSAMRIGDVLRTPHPLSVPLHVVDDRGRTVCGAFLGSSNGRRAIELLDDAPSFDNRADLT